MTNRENDSRGSHQDPDEVSGGEVYIVTKEWSGQRIDQMMAGLKEDISRNHIQVLIHRGHVRVNGNRTKPAYRLREGDRIEVRWVSFEPVTHIEPVHRSVRILEANANYLVVYKPSGLVVHPGAGAHDDTLAGRLVKAYPEIASVGHPMRPGIVHRLDRVTAGLLVVARTQTTYYHLVSAFKERRIRKIYMAYVWGRPKPFEGTIRNLIGRHPVHRKRYAVVKRNGKIAMTRYRVMAVGPWFSLVRIRLITGRTHQIRVHFAAMGHPVVGDPVYGSRNPQVIPSSRLLRLLHWLRNRPAIGLLAYKLRIPEPIPIPIRVYRSPIPHWFRDLGRFGNLPRI